MADSSPGLYPPDAVIRRVSGESVLLLGGGRALLMQLAHPGVAAGVFDHSDFRTDPFSRLQRTLKASYTMVFGTEEEARRTAAGIRGVHERVVGPGYSANDPDLVLWVHATLTDTALRVYQRFVGDLTPEEAEQYYEESTLQAELLGVPRGQQPADLAEFRYYVRTMVATLEVGDAARQLARSVLYPSVPLPGVSLLGEPAFAFIRQVTVGLLPLPLRLQYGFSWDGRRKAALLAAGAASRQVLPRLPSMLRRARAA